MPLALPARLARALVAFAAGAVSLAAVATAQEVGAANPDRTPILITVDQAKVMRIARPADTVIIGNPSIADATIKDDRTLIITGRSFGTTNLIVLDADGQPIADELLTVSAQTGQITVFRRSDRMTYSCTPICQATLNVGDNADAFDQFLGQIQQRGDLAGN